MSAAVSPSGSGASARLRLLMAALAAAALLGGSASCGSSSSHTLTSPSGSRCGLQVQADSAAFSPEGGPGTARVSATRECTWSARAEAPWLSLASPATGQGEGAVQFTVAANADPSTRTGGIEINDQRVQVSQAGTPCQLRLSSTEEFVEIRGGERTIHITASSSQCRWAAVPHAPWITVLSGREGSGDGTVTFGVSAAETVPRTGSLAIAGHVVQVEQAGPIAQGPGCSYAVSATAASLGAEGGSGDILVSAPGGCAWSAESHVPWITVTSGTAGSGAGLVRFEAGAAGAAARVGTLAVAGHLVTVSQSPECRHSVDPPSFSVPDTGGAGAIAIRTGPGCGWSAASSVAWATITAGQTGSGPGEVRFSVAPSTGPARTGTIRVGSEVVTIAQAPGCAFTVSPIAAPPAPAAGASGSIQIAGGAGCAWTAGSDSAWVTLTGATGTGSGQVGYSVAANTGPGRQATLTIAGRAVTIAQANGCTYRVSERLQDVAHTGGAGSVSLATAAGCPWSGASSAAWLTLATASGVGPGQVPFTAAPNAGPPRSATMTVAGQPASVNQASACTWRFAPPSHEFSASGGGGTALVIVTGTCTWTAESTVDWITITAGVEGAGNGMVQFTAAPNTGPARSGSITIAGSPYVVVQRAR